MTLDHLTRWLLAVGYSLNAQPTRLALWLASAGVLVAIHFGVDLIRGLLVLRRTNQPVAGPAFLTSRANAPQFVGSW